MAIDIGTPALELIADGTGRASSQLAETLARCEETGRSVFLFGADAAGIRALRACVARDFPRLRIAGICDADFTGPAGAPILEHIAACRPDIVIVDLPSTRHRALIAEVAAFGLRFTLINRPGSFASYSEGLAGIGAFQHRAGLFGKLAGDLRAACRFGSALLRQFVQQGGPRLSLRE